MGFPLTWAAVREAKPGEQSPGEVAPPKTPTVRNRVAPYIDGLLCCELCGFKAKTKAAIANHRRFKHDHL